MKIKTPAKLILTGEHAVVHGQPAIATAVQCYATTDITASDHSDFRFICDDLNINCSKSLDELLQLHADITQRYQQFVDKKIPVSKILNTPEELCLFAFINCLQATNVTPKQGATLTLTLDIPMGCGMGSSAASIVSLMRATLAFYQKTLLDRELLALALQAENLQHGYSSGLDLHVCHHGGLIHFQRNHAEPLPIVELPFYLIHTGTPACTTGDCVDHVTSHFQQDEKLWQEFAEVGNRIYQALCSNHQNELIQSLQKNHQLLIQIGVVPTAIQKFIAEIEALGSAAKVCGAGAVTGDSAGMLIAVKNKQIEELCHHHGFSLHPLEVDHHGSTII